MRHYLTECGGFREVVSVPDDWTPDQVCTDGAIMIREVYLSDEDEPIGDDCDAQYDTAKENGEI